MSWPRFLLVPVIALLLISSAAFGVFSAVPAQAGPLDVRIHLQSNDYQWIAAAAGAAYLWHDTGLNISVDEAAAVHNIDTDHVVQDITLTLDDGTDMTSCGPAMNLVGCGLPGNIWINSGSNPGDMGKHTREIAHELGHALGLYGTNTGLPNAVNYPGYDGWGHRVLGQQIPTSVMTGFLCDTCLAPDTLDIDTVRTIWGLSPVTPAVPIVDGESHDAYETRMCQQLAAAKPWINWGC